MISKSLWVLLLWTKVALALEGLRISSWVLPFCLFRTVAAPGPEWRSVVSVPGRAETRGFSSAPPASYVGGALGPAGSAARSSPASCPRSSRLHLNLSPRPTTLQGEREIHQIQILVGFKFITSGYIHRGTFWSIFRGQSQPECKEIITNVLLQ